MRIRFTSIFVDDQEAALRFYTDILGFSRKADLPLGDGVRWLTVVSPEDPDGPELVLEPSNHPAVAPFKAALMADGIPFAAISNPRLTTGATPAPEMGRLAAASLVRAIQLGSRPEAILLPPELIVRESTRTLSPSAPKRGGSA